jgi:AcrR family transcriptional regulator
MTAPARIDRRQRRRLDTIEEIVDTAVEVMTEHGVGGLSLGEVARRMGMRTPSLYVYFDSKNAVYDAVFSRGWRSLYEAMDPMHAQENDIVQVQPFLLEVASRFIRWTMEHPAYSQLMMWRPVPGYEPSAEAFATAVDMLESARAMFVRLVDRGLIRKDVTVDELLQTWTVLTSGVMTRQLANAPHETFEEGRVTATLPTLVAMFTAHFGASRVPTTRGKS